MSTHQNQQQRLQEVGDALLNLSSGKRLSRREIFSDSPRKGWHNHFLERLIAEELILKYTTSGNHQDTTYEAVDGVWFESLTSDTVRLAEWYFRRGIVPETSPVLRENDKFEVTPVEPPGEIEQVAEAGPEQTLQQKILDTLVLCAENIVYMRDRLEALHAKVDALTGVPEDIEHIQE